MQEVAQKTGHVMTSLERADLALVASLVKGTRVMPARHELLNLCVHACAHLVHVWCMVMVMSSVQSCTPQAAEGQRESEAWTEEERGESRAWTPASVEASG